MDALKFERVTGIQILFAAVGRLGGVYNISTFVGYLMPNPFLYK